MSSEEQKAHSHIGETKAIRNHDHDLIHDLSQRLDSVWRYDQYIANAEDAPKVQALWQEIKDQELKNCEKLKGLIREHVRNNDF